MGHLPVLVYDLALILIVAGVVTVLFRWLKQPLVLGYIVAGLLAGPHVGLIPTVVDTADIATWADIGVIFLLFALGLEFSFKKLMSVGKTGAVTAVTEVVSMFIVGCIVGLCLGWPWMDSLFLGGMMSMASTTIIIKAFDDLGLRQQKFARLVFGVLVVEDLVAILLMVLLSTLAVSKSFSGAEMVTSLIRLGFFLIIWFVLGIYLIPTLLKKARPLMNDETLLIVCLGLCLVMVVLAVSAGFSAALGAFIMGSILAETVEVDRIERVLKPVKDLFGAIFFVSVGMMVDPQILLAYAVPIAVITLATVFGQVIFSSGGMLLSGQPLRVAMQAGFSLAQIGEFAFIIASLGQSLHVTSAFLYPIAVMVSVITTFFTPYMISLADPVYRWTVRHLPERILRRLPADEQDTISDTGSDRQEEIGWGLFIRRYLTRFALFSALLYGICLLSFRYLVPFLQRELPEPTSAIVSAVIVLLLMSPFLRALMYNKDNMSSMVLNLWIENGTNRMILSLLMLLRFMAAFAFVVYVLHHLFAISPSVVLLITLVFLFAASKSKRLLRWYWHLESRFLVNLNERQVEQRRAEELKRGIRNASDVASRHWLDSELYVMGIVLLEGNPYAGKMLRETDLRSVYNVCVLRVQQVHEPADGTERPDGPVHDVTCVNIPVGDYRLEVRDILYVAGEKEALMRLQRASCWQVVRNSWRTLHEFSMRQEKMHDDTFRLMCVAIPIVAGSGLLHANLREAALSRNTRCLVIGLERGGEQIVNPPSDTTLALGDLVWIIGERLPVEAMIGKNVFL